MKGITMTNKTAKVFNYGTGKPVSITHEAQEYLGRLAASKKDGVPGWLHPIDMMWWISDADQNPTMDGLDGTRHISIEELPIDQIKRTPQIPDTSYRSPDEGGILGCVFAHDPFDSGVCTLTLMDGHCRMNNPNLGDTGKFVVFKSLKAFGLPLVSNEVEPEAQKFDFDEAPHDLAALVTFLTPGHSAVFFLDEGDYSTRSPAFWLERQDTSGQKNPIKIMNMRYVDDFDSSVRYSFEQNGEDDTLFSMPAVDRQSVTMTEEVETNTIVVQVGTLKITRTTEFDCDDEYPSAQPWFVELKTARPGLSPRECYALGLQNL